MKTSIVLFLLCITSSVFAQNTWDNIVVTENTEIFIDSTSLSTNKAAVYAKIKTVYTTLEARQNYVDRIKPVFKKNADKKIKKWDNFSYTITYGLYDCSNSRFKILEVEDYNADDKLIVKTKVKENKAKWLNVSTETVGDYTLFSVCDYGQ